MHRALIAATALGSLGLAAPAHAATVAAFPSPDVKTASPRTTISVRGTTAAALRGMRVTGSRSGAHTGRIRAHADGQGASFEPSSPFRAGERVTVRLPAGLSVTRGDGRAFGFTVARTVGGFATEGASGAPRGDGGFARLRSAPQLAPPTVRSLVNAPGQTAGLISLAPKLGTGQGGPMLVDSAGTPLWFKPLGTGVRATDFRVQSYGGKPALTWWEGRARGGSGRGEGVIADSSYRVIKRVRAGNGLAADLHEFLLTDRGTALLLSYVPVRYDLSPVGGPSDGIAVDGVVQEVELATGLVRFEWHSLGVVSLKDSDVPKPTSDRQAYDYFHVNSAGLDRDGGFVVSARHVSTAYKIDPSGAIVWRLGGRSGTLKEGPGVKFTLQHDVRAQADGTYTVFDNEAEGVRKATRLETIAVDPVKRTATLVRALSHPDDVLAATQGDFQLLPGGSAFANWGSQGRLSEFTPAGKLVLDLKLPKGYDSYRGYRVGWVGQPATKPRLALDARSGKTAVYASYNGATELRAWRVLAGADREALRSVTDVARGPRLETAALVSSSARWFAVQALDGAGRVLGTSPAQRVAGR